MNIFGFKNENFYPSKITQITKLEINKKDNRKRDEMSRLERTYIAIIFVPKPNRTVLGKNVMQNYYYQCKSSK